MIGVVVLLNVQLWKIWQHCGMRLLWCIFLGKDGSHCF